MPSLDWLTARPIAHRGLHDAASGVIENTASAFSAAIAGNYGIECDLQISADGEAMVHHDFNLGRLTDGNTSLAALSAAEIKVAPFKATSDRVMTLGELCDLVSGRVVLAVEIKSRFDGDRRLVQRAADILSAYTGPAAAMSFDPGAIEALRSLAPQVIRGIVAERHYDHPEWAALTAAQKWRLAFLTHAGESRPQFVAYAVRDLPGVAPGVAKMFRIPVLTWTVRSAADRERAARYADQMIFEGFRP